MNLSDLPKRIAEAGASGLVVAMVAEAVGVRTNPDKSGKPTPWEMEIYRRVEAWRKAKLRKKRSKINESAEANDAANDADFSRPEISGNVISLPLTKKKQEESIQGKEGRKKSSENTRARGTRLPEDWQPSEADRKFARDNGIDPDWLRDEFVDFWTNIPGVRGLKLNWSKTWHTRVRTLTSSKKAFTGGQNGSSNRKDRQSAVIERLSQYGSGGNSEPDALSEIGPRAGG